MRDKTPRQKDKAPRQNKTPRQKMTSSSLALYFMSLVLCAIWVPASQAQPAGFEPTAPFTSLKTAEDWTKLVRTNQPKLDPQDRFYNLTSAEWADAWMNNKRKQGISNEEFLNSLKPKGGFGVNIKSPYPYKSAAEHYEAWLKAANGGTKPTRENLPDWSGDWQGLPVGVLRMNALVRDVWDATSPQYQPYFQQVLSAELEGRHWWSADGCYPDGMGRFYTLGGTYHFMMDPSIVLIDKDRPNSETRYVYTDGRGFLPEDYRFPMWYGQSKGFWAGDELVVWTNNYKGWLISHGMGEYSDKLEVIERIKRLGDRIVLDITLYDPEAFAYPWHDVVVFSKLKDWRTAPPTFYDCASTNNVYHDENGHQNEYAPGDLNYHDPSDPRPWATVFDRAEKSNSIPPLLRSRTPK